MTPENGLRSAIWFGLILRVVIALWNGLDGPSFGADADAANFQSFAVAVSEGRWAPGAGLTSFSYAYVLGFIYRLTGPSLLLGSLLSCAAWLASALVAVAAMRLLRVGTAFQALAMVVYAVLPSSVLWTSVTLREPYQLLCVNIMLYASLRILIERSHRHWVCLLAAVAAGAMLHEALLGLGLFVISMLLVRQIWWTPWLARYRTAAVILLAVTVVAGGLVVFRTLYFNHSLAGGPAESVARYLQRGLKFPSRTVYRHGVSIDSPPALLKFVPASLFAYLFEPMPWNVNAPIDAGFVAENVLRALLIGLGFRNWARAHGPERGQVAFVLAAYFCLETLWSVGTFNWGTAARHHIPALGLLLAGAFAYTDRIPMRWRPGSATTT
jgi:hypothetical protein